MEDFLRWLQGLRHGRLDGLDGLQSLPTDVRHRAPPAPVRPVRLREARRMLCTQVVDTSHHAAGIACLRGANAPRLRGSGRARTDIALRRVLRRQTRTLFWNRTWKRTRRLL